MIFVTKLCKLKAVLNHFLATEYESCMNNSMNTIMHDFTISVFFLSGYVEKLVKWFLVWQSKKIHVFRASVRYITANSVNDYIDYILC